VPCRISDSRLVDRQRPQHASGIRTASRSRTIEGLAGPQDERGLYRDDKSDDRASVGLVGSHLRGDQFYGQVVSVAGSMAIVRSEIEPYRRPIARWFTRPHSVLWPEEGKVRAAPEAVVQERVLGERV